MNHQILNIGKSWTQEEDTMLSNLYNNDKLDVIQIATIHQRAPGGIISRLLKNKIILDKKLARGFDNILKLEDKKPKIYKKKDNPDKIIMIDNKEYVTNGNAIWEVKKDKGNIYGIFDSISDEVISYSESSIKIINWLENFKDKQLSVGYVGNQFEYVQTYLEGQIKFTNCMNEINQKFDIIITNHFFDTKLTPEEKVGKLKLLNDNLIEFGELILVEQLCFYETIVPFITNTKVIINEMFSNSFFIRTTKKQNIKAINLMVLDTETTGFPLSRDPKEFEKFNSARLIELGYIVFDKTGQDINKYDNLIKPDNFMITNSFIHGIKQEDALKNGKNISEVLDQLVIDLKKVDGIVCHNISFDMAIILAEAHRAKKFELIKLIEEKLHICSMATGKKFMKNDKNPKLVELYKFLFNKDFIQDHRALSDCVACAECYFGMINIL